MQTMALRGVVVIRGVVAIHTQAPCLCMKRIPYANTVYDAACKTACEVRSAAVSGNHTSRAVHQVQCRVPRSPHYATFEVAAPTTTYVRHENVVSAMEG